MSYPAKHAKPTSLMDTVLGHHEPADTSVLPAGRHASREHGPRAHGSAPEAGAGLAALRVPGPRQSPDAEKASNPAA
jgi:hypothetical protein